MNLLREYIREELLYEKAQQEASLFSSISDFIETSHYDDVMDSVFKKIAPNMVRHVLEQEINEDMAEFLDGAIEGRWEKQRDWAGEDPSPEEHGHSKDSTDYALGYSWGWNNAGSWEGNTLPAKARKEAVEIQIAEFEDQVSEQMVIAALEAANDKVNPVKLLGKAKDAITSAVQEDGWVGGVKKGLPIAIGIIVGEALDNVIIPMAFYSMTGIPIPPLPVGVGEIINPVVISMVGADVETEELADELGWYEKEYGAASSLGPKPTNELRVLIREMLIEMDLGVGTGIEYTAFVLDDASHQALADLAPPGWKVFSHHMTIINPPNQKQRLPARWLNQKISITATAVAGGSPDDAVMTAMVDLNNQPVPMKGPAFPHVTIATNPAKGGKPAMSNNFTNSDFEPIDPIQLTGTIEEIIR